MMQDFVSAVVPNYLIFAQMLLIVILNGVGVQMFQMHFTVNFVDQLQELVKQQTIIFQKK
ncbi:hypothetical protein DSOL_3292 [Desulfosporosinus metallidurans]|uniref:Uncharacterized protein n=1 Tax=Desulfosporosinus metallidurans TaxID=1888891 RepID=A0A1Q8QRM6_9FIRM|nr:hypothetical protein DSOL_3292 [Desulfosporosinus metallidurans]